MAEDPVPIPLCRVVSRVKKRIKKTYLGLDMCPYTYRAPPAQSSIVCVLIPSPFPCPCPRLPPLGAMVAELQAVYL